MDINIILKPNRIMDKIFLVNLYKVTNHILFKKAIDEDYPQIKQILILNVKILKKAHYLNSVLLMFH